MRKLTDHMVAGDSANHQLTIEVMDEPGQGGAHYRYDIYGFDTRGNPAEKCNGPETDYVWLGLPVIFQNGPIKEVGVNGVTHEAFLAILIDRFRSFQAGPYNNEENQNVLHYLEQAMFWMHERTRKRLARGVEGTHQK